MADLTGNDPFTTLDAADCLAIYEALEVTVESLDRPEPGAREHLLTLLDVFRGATSAHVWAKVPDFRCRNCGDHVHAQADGPSVPAETPLSERTWFDSAGDPHCWAADNGKHVPVVDKGEEVDQ